jgi:hypothetical protein
MKLLIIVMAICLNACAEVPLAQPERFDDAGFFDLKRPECRSRLQIALTGVSQLDMAEGKELCGLNAT